MHWTGPYRSNSVITLSFDGTWISYDHFLIVVRLDGLPASRAVPEVHNCYGWMLVLQVTLKL